jgi:ADP-heptose:LPS heptosyltransferase
MPPGRKRNFELPRRTIFAIRSKLGDTLISFQCVRDFADAYPDDEITLLTRAAYARLFADEAGIRVIGFDSRIGMALKLLWLRIRRPAFDVLAVLWGSGPPIKLIGRLVNARRKIAWSRKFAPEIFEAPDIPAEVLLVEPAARTVRMIEPAFANPRRLKIPGLAARYARADDRVAVGIVPVADEARRNLDLAALGQLIAEVRQRHPQAPIRIFVNPGNAGTDALIAMQQGAGCEVRTFRDLATLTDEYLQLTAWYGTDTGLYHLAVAMGIPATVFFGPTQPHKIVMPGQTGVRVWRLAALGDAHCDEKSCQRPLCLHAAVATWGGVTSPTRLDETPAACPLRAADPATRSALRDASPA